ncbi:unnamed protein product [Owenia fusiformis]|uniref:Rapamycin-insensitive companion of mTOR n=1 Tax=Owenia fusiformis TaxID=6347 RepID=A0A8S4N3V5_OWEFU|nr:unnamed protein product [Owenia fusiformis]
MAVAMRSLRAGRFRGRRESREECLQLDFSREKTDLTREILLNVSKSKDIPTAKILGYLNGFVKLWSKFGPEADYGYSLQELLCCIRLALLHEAKEVRAAGLRVLRYMLRHPDTMDIILHLHIDYFIARALDICLDNELERSHALRLMRKIVDTCPAKFPTSLLNVLVSIGNNGAKESDRMLRVCLATIAELAVRNPTVAAKCGAVKTLLRNVLDHHLHPRICEALLMSVMYLLNHPSHRHFVKLDVDLEQLLAPLTDCHYRFSAELSEYSKGEDRESRFQACRLALVTIIRSWPGMIRLCRPDASGIQSLLGTLYLNDPDIKKNVLELVFSLFYIKVPTWTTNFDGALASSDPSQMQNSWKLMEGFVAEEGKCLLPHTSAVRSNLLENHLALLLNAFIHAGLLEGLVEVVVSQDQHLAVRATILLGELLYLANSVIPHECSQHSHCLPTLVAVASSFQVTSQLRQQASMAINQLSQIHALKKRGTVPASLYLDQILQQSRAAAPKEKNRPLKLTQFNLLQCISKENDDLVSQAIKDSKILSSQDWYKWDIQLISSILSWPDDNLKKLDDQISIRFVQRLTQFLKPSSRQYASIEQSHKDAKLFSVAGCHFVDFLLSCEETEAQTYINELFLDIASCLSEIRSERAPLDALLSPSNVINTLCQDYFLLMGRFTFSAKGEEILQKTGLIQYLLDLVTITTHDTYVKLIVSSLDYSRDGITRIILSKALTATSENARLYTASFLRVLLRANVPFLSSWGMELLVTQLYDQSKMVALEAISVLDEACENEANLASLVQMRPSMLHLGDKGALLLCRFLSIPSGFKFLRDANYINNELDKWHESFNTKYVKIVEEKLNEAFTTYERASDGSYTRVSGKQIGGRAVYVPVHLYGQLIQHKEGAQLLEKQSYLSGYFQCVRFQMLATDDDILKLKTALWVTGHIGTSSWGISLLEEESVITDIIKLAEECGVFSIRGTAYYVLGLIGSTSPGADKLQEYGWESVRHSHCSPWPIADEEDYFDEVLSEFPSNASSINLSCSSIPSIFDPDIRLRSSSMRSSAPTSPCSKPPVFSFEADGESLRDRSDSTTLSSSLPPQPSIITEDSETRETNHLTPSQKSATLPVTKRDKSDLKAGLQVLYESTDVLNGDEEPASDELPVVMRSPHKHSSHGVKSRSANINCESRPVGGTPELKRRGGSYRDERSNSDESSKSKSRSDTDNSTTSGVSSYDSGRESKMCIEASELTPIPSLTSINTNEKYSVDSEPIHPSEPIRRLANLRRVPSLRRRFSNPGINLSSPLKTQEGKPIIRADTFSYTSTLDAQGYATLKTLRHRQRTRSTNEDPDLDIPYDDLDNAMKKTRSLDFRNKNLSYISLHDSMLQDPLDLQGPASPGGYTIVSNLPKTGKKSSGVAEYVGLALPVDIMMIFQVTEGEDPRCPAVAVDKEETNVDPTTPKSASATDGGVGFFRRSASQVDDGLEYHNDKTCIGCSKGVKKVVTDTSVSLVEIMEEPFIGMEYEGQRSRAGSRAGSRGGSRGGSPYTSKPRSDSGDITSSYTSNTSIDSNTKQMTEDSFGGRVLIRKEILRLIIILSSSVGTKSSEQGLLSLKQKFPKSFQDVCLYSEVCYILANYIYRLNARRFIQELFQDIPMDELFEEASTMLQKVNTNNPNSTSTA